MAPQKCLRLGSSPPEHLQSPHPGQRAQAPGCRTSVQERPLPPLTAGVMLTAAGRRCLQTWPPAGGCPVAGPRPGNLHARHMLLLQPLLMKRQHPSRPPVPANMLAKLEPLTAVSMALPRLVPLSVMLMALPPGTAADALLNTATVISAKLLCWLPVLGAKVTSSTVVLGACHAHAVVSPTALSMREHAARDHHLAVRVDAQEQSLEQQRCQEGIAAVGCPAMTHALGRPASQTTPRFSVIRLRS